jgi:hypothetical protein
MSKCLTCAQLLTEKYRDDARYPSAKLRVTLTHLPLPYRCPRCHRLDAKRLRADLGAVRDDQLPTLARRLHVTPTQLRRILAG